MKIRFLGTGTSQGIPVIACNCPVCKSSDSRDKRLRSSIMVSYREKNYVIDTGPDFRQQMLANEVDALSAVLFTHEHKDHVAGLDDVRAFNFKLKRPIDVYAEERVQDALRREYAYIFSERPYPGIPEIRMHTLKNQPVDIDGLRFIPIRVMHYRLPVLGFRIGDFAYLTDVKTIPEEELDKLAGLEVLVITTLRKEEHISHMNLEEALAAIDLLKPKKAYLTHLSHRFGLHATEERELPENVRIAYDGLSLTLSYMP
ncbi:MAG: MBL fold metallo-hydrolase [Bacteroidales bacterium]|nr:MBL fold metallo-hydrolase [Bacteroidales bacterium]